LESYRGRYKREIAEIDGVYFPVVDSSREEIYHRTWQKYRIQYAKEAREKRASCSCF